MKLFLSALTFTLLGQSIGLAKDIPRKPDQVDSFTAQVQLCEGTEALGNEGQGMGASAFVNVYSEMNSTAKPAALKCDLAFAFAYEYGNDRGIKLGEISPYNLTPVSTGKTDCQVKQENGDIFLHITKAV